MDEIMYIILIILILIFVYHLTDENVEIYNDEIYFDKFRYRKLSFLESNNELKTPKIKNNKILIITYENRRNLNYVKIHNENVKKYVDKYDFKYKFYDECKHNNYWCKLYLVYKKLMKNKYDYVMWMDSDTIFFNMNINLSSILNNYSSDIYVGSDNNPTHDLINSGVFIIKNSKTGKQFIADCINSFNKKCKKNNGELKGIWAGSCYEQGVMNILIADKYYKYTTLLSNRLIHNFYKCDNDVFIMHMYASSPEDRERCFLSYNNDYKS